MEAQRLSPPFIPFLPFGQERDVKRVAGGRSLFSDTIVSIERETCLRAIRLWIAAEWGWGWGVRSGEGGWRDRVAFKSLERLPKLLEAERLHCH